MRPDLPQLALQEVNLALRDLGIADFHVESIAKEPQTVRDADSYAISLASAEDRSKVYSLKV